MEPKRALAATLITTLLIGAFARASQACVGDCNGDARVSIDELVRGVNISLEAAALELCPAIDNSLDGSASVNEVVLSVNRALRGCHMGPHDVLLYSSQGNQLDIYGLVNDRSDVLVPMSRGHVNGQVCLLPDGSGSFVIGDDTGQPEVRPGWGIYSSDGTFLQSARC
jgi:hypothetical protein